MVVKTKPLFCGLKKGQKWPEMAQNGQKTRQNFISLAIFSKGLTSRALVRQSLNVSGNVRRWDTQSVPRPFPPWKYFIFRLNLKMRILALSCISLFILFKLINEQYKTSDKLSPMMINYALLC